jgi:hypothetical protein
VRDRRKDIVPLAHHFIQRKPKQLGLSRPLRLAKASLPAGGKISPTSGQMIDTSAMPLPELLKTAKENLPTPDQAMTEQIKLALQLCNGRIYGSRVPANCWASILTRCASGWTNWASAMAETASRHVKGTPHILA